MYRRILPLVLLPLLLLVIPAQGSPALMLGSSATYHVSATLHFESSCTSDPVQYAGQACNPTIYYPRPVGVFPANFTIIPPTNRTIVWVTNGAYNLTSFPYPIPPRIIIYDDCNTGHLCNSCSSAISCGFYPTSVTALQGEPVAWYNNGTLVHEIVANVTGTGTILFDSGILQPNRTFTYTFQTPGVYYFHDADNRGPVGTVTVLQYPSPPQICPLPLGCPAPAPTSLSLTVAGTIVWTVIGLDSSNAVLRVDHDLSLSISPSPIITITPIRETGSFEQSIDLSTRVESPGLATQIVDHILKQFLGIPIPAFSSPVSATGIPFQGTNPFPVYPVNYQIPNLGLPDKMYTIWWVNGPLAMGTPVNVLTGLASVTGNENLTVDPLGGLRPAWLVTSNWDENVNAAVPFSGSNHVSASLDLSWAYDKQNDLLLQSSSSASVSSVSTSKQSIYPPVWPPCTLTSPSTVDVCPLCGTLPCPSPTCIQSCPTIYCIQYPCNTPIEVNVTRTTSVTLDLSLTLTGTSFSKDTGRSSTIAASQSPPLAPLTAMSLMVIGGAGLAALASVGAIAWLVQRRKSKTGLAPPTAIQPTV